MTRLLVTNPRERIIVRLADVFSTPLNWVPARRTPPSIDRILLLRLERIGDLLMTLEAIEDARRAWPAAAIDIAVGSWNADLARMIPGVRSVLVADLPWLSRGEQRTSWPTIIREARRWGGERYDLVVNFEPDIRTNFLAWLTRAPVRVGYDNGGGGSFLTTRATYDPALHVSVNARQLIARARGVTTSVASISRARLAVPAELVTRAIARIGTTRRPWIGVHASGGRESKQWHLDRFASVARQLAQSTGGTIVLTGGTGDLAIVRKVASTLDDVPHVSVAGTESLPDLGGILAALDLLVTGDTGPMHLAAAVGTPVVALFGPSDPARYGPRAELERVVRVQLPCSPCGQVRLPPERCRGHVPDCMNGISVDAVVTNALDVLADSTRRRGSTPA